MVPCLRLNLFWHVLLLVGIVTNLGDVLAFVFYLVVIKSLHDFGGQFGRIVSLLFDVMLLFL